MRRSGSDKIARRSQRMDVICAARDGGRRESGQVTSFPCVSWWSRNSSVSLLGLGMEMRTGMKTEGCERWHAIDAAMYVEGMSLLDEQD